MKSRTARLIIEIRYRDYEFCWYDFGYSAVWDASLPGLIDDPDPSLNYLHKEECRKNQ